MLVLGTRDRRIHIFKPEMNGDGCTLVAIDRCDVSGEVESIEIEHFSHHVRIGLHDGSTICLKDALSTSRMTLDELRQCALHTDDGCIVHGMLALYRESIRLLSLLPLSF